MSRLTLWIIVLGAVLVSAITALSLLAIYLAPPSLSDLVGPQFGVGFFARRVLTCSCLSDRGLVGG
jgi:hypothetical protein